MELEELKTAWKVHSGTGQAEWIVSRPNLENMMRRKSGQIRQRLIRSMGRDALWMVLINLVFIAVIYSLDLEWKHISALAVLAIMFLLFVHYHIQTLLLQRTGILGTVKEEITQTLALIRNYTRIYTWGIPLIMSLLFFGAFTFGIFNKLGWVNAEIDLTVALGTSTLAGLVILVVLRAIIKWTVGAETRQLVDILRDLENG